ncbi:DMT family transporter [Streptomyces sp. NBC_00038]|uniref:DMT family transporter n=1 Tax=Streptomyces sp. NBC_00038 TaxID=2903615 RepID=UPI002258A159|nr:DMT family transporter [Streptomyces sp. NBC_00038]MCX5555162.1 DMT family transporter [Streptomyces sp. NBC_00038]
MSTRATDWLLAVAGGVLLTLMTEFNGQLAHHTTAVYASWVAHGIGAVVALVLVGATARAVSRPRPLAEEPGRAPLWFYLGGIPGAFVVILSAISVNSELALSGTIALMLTGQVLFGVASDQLGLLRIPKRRVTATDLATAGLVLAGSVLIVLGGA